MRDGEWYPYHSLTTLAERKAVYVHAVLQYLNFRKEKRNTANRENNELDLQYFSVCQQTEDLCYGRGPFSVVILIFFISRRCSWGSVSSLIVSVAIIVSVSVVIISIVRVINPITIVWRRNRRNLFILIFKVV